MHGGLFLCTFFMHKQTSQRLIKKSISSIANALLNPFFSGATRDKGELTINAVILASYSLSQGL
jgi:hypothetical protein